MKKLLILIVLSASFLLCGCTQSAPSYKTELINSAWKASAEGGAEAELGFSGEPDGLSADFIIKNAGKTVKISGKCVADEHSFVIFDASVLQNYAFDYVPKGDTLDLTYNNKTITFQKQP